MRNVKSADQLVTKGYLDKRLRKEFLDYNTNILETMESYLSRFEEKLLTFKDEIIGEFKKTNENIAALTYRQSEHSDQLENHEQRLTKVELRFADK